MFTIIANVDIIEGTFAAGFLPPTELLAIGFLVITLVLLVFVLILDLILFFSHSGRELFDAIEARGIAIQMIANGHNNAAANCLEDAEQHSPAVIQFEKAGEFMKASKILMGLGYFDRAVAELSDHEQGVAAAKIFEQHGRKIDAAYEYEKAERYDDAAFIFLEEKRFYDAARCFRDGKRYLDAAKYYEQESVLFEAAHALTEQVRILEFKVNEQPSLYEEKTRLNLRAAQCFEQCKAYDEAAQIYEEEGEFEKAGENYKACNRLQQASLSYRRAGKLRIAADLQEQIGDQVKALVTRAEAAIAENDYLQAGDLYASAEQHQQAAECYERVQIWDKAAEMHERAGDLDLAQAAYVKNGDFARAGRMAEKRKDLEAAAQFYEKAGDLDAQVRIHKQQGNLSQSAKILIEMRRLEDADQVIANMDANDPSAIQTLEELGDILRDRGRLEDAYSRYRVAVGNRPVDDSTIKLYRKMAEVLAESNEVASAQNLIEKILHYKPDDSASIKILNQIDSLRIKRQENSLLAAAHEKAQHKGPKDVFGPSDDKEGRYEIIDEIARGGMGIVYRARDRFLDRVVALKLLNENFTENEVAIQYFVREARAAAALNHPGIVTIFDVGQQQGQVFMAMELIDGTTLKHYIRHKGILSESQIIWIIIQCCTALDYAHSKGIIHRDIKSGNVMLTRDKSLKIMDFGLAKAIQNQQGNHTQLIGTPYYMSPEQVSGINVDFRSDLYSLGCMIYECATGRVPFKDGEPAYHHVHTLPTPPIELNPKISPKLNSFILRLLEKLPDNRFQSAAECLEYVKAM